MSTFTKSRAGEPLTFTNAPTVIGASGRRHLTDDAARELGDRLARENAELLAALADE